MAVQHVCTCRPICIVLGTAKIFGSALCSVERLRTVSPLQGRIRPRLYLFHTHRSHTGCQRLWAVAAGHSSRAVSPGTRSGAVATEHTPGDTRHGVLVTGYSPRGTCPCHSPPVLTSSHQFSHQFLPVLTTSYQVSRHGTKLATLQVATLPVATG